MIDRENILGVGITSATKKEILEYIVKNVENFKKKLFVVTPNPEFLVLANKDKVFKDVLNKADLALADGVGVVIAAKLIGKPLKERFTGIDLVKSLCGKVSEKPITVGFLGGRGDVAEKTAECLRKIYPKLKVGFVGEEWPNEWLSGSTHSLKDSSEPDGNTSLVSRDESNSTAYVHQKSLRDLAKNSFYEEFRSQNEKSKTLNRKSLFLNPIDILFVAFGAPKQEFWIKENLDKIPVKVSVGVGGAFDYISGRVPRAPFFVRKLGMEWLFRLVIQPWRIKRQLSLLKFIWLVAREKLNNN